MEVRTQMANITQNDRGTIKIADDVIVNIIGHTIAEGGCYGIVGMASKKATDGIFELLNRENYGKGVKISYDENGALIAEIHVIVEYGTPIRVLADSAMDMVRYTVEKVTDIVVQRVDVVVEGIRVDKAAQ
jgi:uncharacterized alkaline shock family protein YloU